MASAASCKWCSRRLAPAPELLMLNPWRVLSSELIYDRIWGYDYGAAANGLRVYIGYPRRKLEADGERRLVQTVHGVGYVLREP